MVRVSILHPDFTWHTVPTFAEQQKSLRKSSDPPPLRRLWPKTIRLLIGRFHQLLKRISYRYSRYYGLRPSGAYAPLPFGPFLKHSDNTSLEEVAGMQLARDGGLPVPMVISYGEHPAEPNQPMSIFMTRMPGNDLFKDLW